MNHYAKALAELQLQPDHELKQIGDQWQTPKALAWGLFHHFAPTLGPVVLDMFADNCNALVPNYYDAADNALTQELASDLRRLGGAAYGNPPYSRPCVDGEGNPITGMEPILNFCREQRAQGAKIMLLIKAATSETWWPEDADFIQFISGRIGFEVPSWYVPRDPKKDKPSSSGFASAVVIFDASWQGERRPEARLRRDDLITTGQIILDLIHRQAVALNEEASQAIAQTASAKPVQSVTVTKTIITAPDRIWLQVGDQSHYHSEQFPTDTSEVSWCADSVMACEVPYVREDLAFAASSQTIAKSVNAELSMLQDQPAVATPAKWEPPVATDNQTNEAAAQELALLEFEDSRPIDLDQIERIVCGNDVQSIEPLNDWQQHPSIKSVIYQIDEADLLTPANTRLLAGYIKGLQASGAGSENTLSQAIQMAKHLLSPEEKQLQLSIDNGEAA